MKRVVVIDRLLSLLDHEEVSNHPNHLKLTNHLKSTLPLILFYSLPVWRTSLSVETKMMNVSWMLYLPLMIHRSQLLRVPWDSQRQLIGSMEAERGKMLNVEQPLTSLRSDISFWKLNAIPFPIIEKISCTAVKLVLRFFQSNTESDCEFIRICSNAIL